MVSKYDLYRPQTLIQDVHGPAKSYYRAPDVALTPFTTIGSLAASEHTTTDSVLLSDNFKLLGLSETSRIAAQSQVVVPPLTTLRNEKYQYHVAEQFGVLMTAATMWHTWVRSLKRVQWVPKKYSLEKGVYINASGKAFTLGKVAGPTLGLLSLLVLFVFLRIGPSDTITKTGQGNTTGGAIYLQNAKNRSASNPGASPDVTNSVDSSNTASWSQQAAPAITTESSSITNNQSTVTSTTSTTGSDSSSGGMGGGSDTITPVIDPPVTVDPVLPVVTDPTPTDTDSSATLGVNTGLVDIDVNL